MDSSVVRPRPVLTAWVVVLGVDLFLNAGLFASLFDQAREPNLLPDEVLFRRIPAAYLVFLVAVVALAWLVTRLGLRTVPDGARVGAGGGIVLGLFGGVAMWTVVDMTGVFVAATVVVFTCEYAAAGATLAALAGADDPGRTHRRALATGATLAALGIVLQNVL